MVTRVSARGVALIKQFEGGQSPDGLFHPYQDSVGVWTIGYGHTEGVGPRSKPLTEKQATELLERDLDEKYARAVAELGLPLNQNQFDALVSFVFNLGTGMIGPEHTIGRALRARDWKHAADAFLLYDRAGGRVLPGLRARREKERELFLTPVAHAARKPARKPVAAVGGACAAVLAWLRRGQP